MEDNKMVNYIKQVLQNIPNDWLRLTTHRLDIYNEKLAKVEFLEHFETLLNTHNWESSALNELPTAYDYIRLGHPLSCVLEWGIAKLHQLNGQKQMIYFVVDNYSRYVLNWCLHPKVCGKTMTALLRNTIDQYTPTSSLLLADGGPENNNRYVDELMENTGMTKLIAQRDISFSNSIVEALIKIIKNSYLYRMEITSVSGLTSALEFSVNDYNSKRPHHSLLGLTPKEAFSGKEVDFQRLKIAIATAKSERIVQNRLNTCGDCLLKK